MIYDFEVTEEDVAEAERLVIRYDPFSFAVNCPVALAIKRATGTESVSADYRRAIVSGIPYRYGDWRRVREIINWFDAGCVGKKPALPLTSSLRRSR